MSWTILKTLEWTTRYLEKKGVPEARLNAEHLLAYALDKKRLDLYLQFDKVLSDIELERFKPLLERRARREPLQYIIGHQPFRNIDIAVDGSVLIPRPETEIVVDEALKLIPPDAEFDILELGIGSGAISAAIADERKNVRITATEISEKALSVALKNTTIFGERIRILLGDLFSPVHGILFDMIISNPPYIPENEWGTLPPEVRNFEPKEALQGGKDGLDFYRRILHDTHLYLKDKGYIILEIGDGQCDRIAEIASGSVCIKSIGFKRDWNNIDRVFIAQKSGG